MINQAFLVGAINKETGEFLGVGLFSEESPTITGSKFLFTILSIPGKDYQDALDKLPFYLEDPQYKWVRKFIRRRK